MTPSATAGYARPLIATLLVLAAYGMARTDRPTDRELADLARGLRFTATVLGLPAAPDLRQVRQVHPEYRHIAAWISSVGAGVALADLDGDGLPNDACHVDPRTDTVAVRAVPETPARYEPVRLDPPAIDEPAIAAPMGCLPGDLDEDGRLDVLVYFWGRTPVAFLRRNSAGAPSYDAVEIVAGRERWYTNAAAFADVDGDTHADLIVGNYFPDGSRVLDPSATTPATMQQSMSRASNGGSKQIWRWTRVADGRPHFEFVADAMPAALVHGWTLALGAADLDGDLRPEIFFANDFGPDVLLHNRSAGGAIRFAPLYGRRGFTTAGSKVLGHDSFKGMGVDFGDVNGDGWLDIIVSNIAAEFALEESHQMFVSTGEVSRMRDGVAPYVDRSEPLGLSRSGWGWDARLADFNNDGTLEVVQATGFLRGTANRWPELHELAMGNDTLLSRPGNWPRFVPGADLNGHDVNPFFVRRGDRFHDVASLVGAGEPQVTRGLAVADVDHDGRLDYAAANQWEPSRFYHNDSDAGAFLGLNLLHARPAGAGSPAIGASVTVRLSDGREWTTYVDGGAGHSGKRSSEVHVGLGAVPADRQVTATIAWRNGERVERTTLALAPGWHTVRLPVPPAISGERR